MAFITITAKYNGTCRRCNGSISKGERIRYDSIRRQTYHFAADCAVAKLAEQDAQQYNQSRNTAPITPSAIMTPELAQDIRQTFQNLLAKPANLCDLATDQDETQPERTIDAIVASSQPTPATTTWREFTKTPSTPYQQRSASIDNDLF